MPSDFLGAGAGAGAASSSAATSVTASSVSSTTAAAVVVAVVVVVASSSAFFLKRRRTNRGTNAAILNASLTTPRTAGLVRDWLASEDCDLGCVEVRRADYEAAAADHLEWARAQEGWALVDDMLELPISILENGKFRVDWRPSSPPLSPEELSDDLEEIMGRESPGMLVRCLIRTAVLLPCCSRPLEFV